MSSALSTAKATLPRRLLIRYLSLPGAGNGLLIGAALLALRLWLARPFFQAGMLRVEHWPSQTFLFGDIHPLPGLDPLFAAIVTTGAELTLPVLLALGLFARPAALGLAVMAAMIYLVVGQTPQGMENGIAVASEQLPWIAAGLIITIAGAGRLSLDRLLARGYGR
ncbi:hypothetical protein GCM10011505_00430 [Tistrella bauzanensis]|uniref:DoxX family protein n=1 Tax=Tistrella bauzanensis TaxID=657419 RepID=A0ABQ1I9A8_9PROT|nr:DoxX family protein [Tistrella bauzanensis]GGB23129.1 hypothetical protein GCM10011505_00430 [Tistrella bauzanensis]